ncbi:short coiled-coil protein [Salegentibacter sp. F188]|uniref:Short coiled-coil protein n=1 Tax=Autumnicola patrickiae TaxID=3075591 RepID=A0ABU3E026_9FLAO|nr:helix-turn-helix domain-containing protein [Salegentibacter sp. F188]MDT0689345.1 short coiled-coil protein [Salegentibacter sp. F188]
MNIKELRAKTGLSQKEFGARLGLTSQSITKFEAGGKVTDTVKKLIRYEFSQHLPEEERLYPVEGEHGKEQISADERRTATKVDSPEEIEKERERYEDQVAKLAEEFHRIANQYEDHIEELKRDKEDLRNDKKILQQYIENLSTKPGGNQQTA